MKRKYDVIVIGSGPGGSSAATRLAREGKQVAIVDHQFGGTCGLKGCTPKKVLAVASEILRYACKLNGHGIDQANTTLNWKDLIKFKNSFTEPIPFLSKENFNKQGITIIEGTASFKNENTIYVDDTEYSANYFIIATGNRPSDLDLPGAEHCVAATDLFDCINLPKRICFVGGGYIAFEFAQILRKADCEVHILEVSDQPLAHFEPAHAGMLVKMFVEEGIHIHLGADVKEIDKSSGQYRVRYLKDNLEQTIECEMVINAAGRTPNIEMLNPEQANIKYSTKGVDTNDFLNTSQEHIYAVGDVTGRWPFTLSADYEGYITSYNITHDRRKKIEYIGFPTVLFTAPKLASVGKSRQQLDDDGIEYESSTGSLSSHLMSRSLQENFNEYILYHKGNELLGAHLFSAKADEVINIFAMAMQHGISLDQLKSTFMTYPSYVSETRKMF